jgi:hypothetical protein
MIEKAILAVGLVVAVYHGVRLERERRRLSKMDEQVGDQALHERKRLVGIGLAVCVFAIVMALLLAVQVFSS